MSSPSLMDCRSALARRPARPALQFCTSLSTMRASVFRRQEPHPKLPLLLLLSYPTGLDKNQCQGMYCSQVTIGPRSPRYPSRSICGILAEEPFAPKRVGRSQRPSRRKCATCPYIQLLEPETGTRDRQSGLACLGQRQDPLSQGKCGDLANALSQLSVR